MLRRMMSLVGTVVTRWMSSPLSSPRDHLVGVPVRGVADEALDYGDHRGRVELRTALSAYLARVRGVRIDPGRMVITQGFTQALDLLCHVLAASGRSTVAMESPSHPGLWATVRQSA